MDNSQMKNQLLISTSAMSEEVEYLSIHARKYKSPMGEHAKCLVESLFLLTLGQDFIMNTRMDGKLIAHDLYVFVNFREITKTPAFNFRHITEQNFRDIIINVGRLVKKNLVSSEAYRYCVEHLNV